MNPVICFIGIDGSGKSTICKSLLNELSAQSIPCRYVYGRFLPKLMLPVFKLTSSLMPEKNKTPNKATRKENKSRMLSNTLISKLFISGIIFDQLLQILFKIYLPSLIKKEVIICDRYFYDTVLIDIAIPLKFDYAQMVRFVEKYLPLFPKANMVFLVDVPTSVAFSRKNDISSIKYIEKLSQSYLNTAKYFKASKIDGTKPLTELMPLLINQLECSSLLEKVSRN